MFSTAPEDGVKYVQDRLWADRADVVELVKQGATVYVCGDGRHMAPQVRDTCAMIYQEATGATGADAAAWMDEVERASGRYVADLHMSGPANGRPAFPYLREKASWRSRASRLSLMTRPSQSLPACRPCGPRGGTGQTGRRR